VAFAAIDLAERIFGKLADRNVLLIGAGETSQLAAKYVAESGLARWRVPIVRLSVPSALAGVRLRQTVPFPPRAEDLAWQNVIISATSSPEP